MVKTISLMMTARIKEEAEKVIQAGVKTRDDIRTEHLRKFYGSF